jgi:GTP cyclohydrolase FolE2
VSGLAARARSHIAIRVGMLRDEIAVRLQRDRRRGRRAVTAKNAESIHYHCAYAEITGLDGALID